MRFTKVLRTKRPLAFFFSDFLGNEESVKKDSNAATMENSRRDTYMLRYGLERPVIIRI